jgi:hypothetical protein
MRGLQTFQDFFLKRPTILCQAIMPGQRDDCCQRPRCLHIVRQRSVCMFWQLLAVMMPAGGRSSGRVVARVIAVEEAGERVDGFMNSSSIFSSRVSRSRSRNRARSLTVSGGSSPTCSRRYANPVPEGALVDTELLRHPGNRARCLDHHLHGFILEFRREALFFGRGKTSPFQIVHPNGWTVRKARGTSESLL